MTTTVKIELAKLLKEKGYNEICVNCYAEERLVNKKTGGDLFTGVYRLCVRSRFHKRYYSAPTIAEVVMWLYEKHGIWISVYEYKDHAADVNDGFVFRSNYTGIKEFISPTEAYEAAIEHTLNNII